MSFLTGQNSTVKQRFHVALLAGSLTAAVLAIASGYFRQHVFDHAIILVLVGLCIALVFQRVGRGVQLRFAMASLFLTLIAIIVSDVITQFGIVGLIELKSYEVIFNFFIHEDIFSLLWLVYRALALYVSYIYSRIV